MKAIRTIFCAVAVLCMFAFAAPGLLSVYAGEAITFGIPVAENENLILWMNENGGIAVENRRTGFLFTSNPIYASSCPLAVAVNITNLQSQFFMQYSNAAGTLSTDAMGVTTITGRGVVATVNSHVGSVMRGGISHEFIPNGVIFRYYFDQFGIVVPLRYTLFDDHLLAEIVVSELEEHAGFRATQFNFLPFFGAGGPYDEGYIFVPCGSGALLHFNNGKARYLAFSAPVYGRDPALTVERMSHPTETIAMPVFGARNGTDGFLGIIQNGASLATIHALTSGTITSFNTVHPIFTYRETAVFTLLVGDNFATNRIGGDATTALLYSPNQTHLPSFSVRYYFLSGPDLSYVDMAHAYRRYLINYHGLTRRESGAAQPLYLSFLGGVTSQRSILGVRFNAVTPLTSFADAQRILESLHLGGVENIVVRYEGVFRGGLGGRIPSDARFERALGGSGDFQALANFSAANSIHIFPDFDLVNFYRRGNGFSRFRHAVQDIGDRPTFIHRFDLNHFNRDNWRRWDNWSRWNILSPFMVRQAFDAVLTNFGRIPVNNIALSALSNHLYSDFSTTEAGINRTGSEEIWRGIFYDATNNFERVMSFNAFAYTFPYVNYIMGASVSSSRFDIVDEDVPFYQIVLHGYVSMSVPPLNHSEDPRRLFLHAIKTGSSLNFTWMANNNSVLAQTPLNRYFSANYAPWLQTAIDLYLEAQPFLNSVACSAISNHRRLARNVYRTDFDNGLSVLVNFSRNVVEIDGQTVNARDFLVIRNGGLPYD